MGAGFSSVDSVVGFVEVSQGNFDLFNPPNFTGGGQKFRLRVQLGTERQDYELSFIEPWFLQQKLALSVDLYRHDLNFQSLENLYDEVQTGGRVGLTRALGSDFLIGSVGYTLEDVGILFNGRTVSTNRNGLGQRPIVGQQSVPNALLAEAGYTVVSKLDFSLAYDTRNSVTLPNKGQRTEATATLAGPFPGDKNYYKLELKSAWYFKGLFPGHVLELLGETGVADSYGSSGDVPFYDRYYLGGLYSLRGFRYRSVSPRERPFDTTDFSREPIGGDTYWFGSAEYSLPIIQSDKERGVGLRFAVFYDIGNVMLDPYSYNFSNYLDNWGLGLRLNLPIGPLRLDYGIPIHHDRFNSGSGQFQFGVGYTRQF
jgi:outer membrane protein insertion porin family